ncbi:amidohydrolase family protein [Aureliella helgolandensis]|uniref:Dihydroorotase n=1 Tax=Aureliella helgolandensis TaxID=2527968 RepID=A0A518GC00_9BACT|nr:amidohydrolase family protein [Aureliella helgolandensis]QDV26104.1 dihydroorotase [Aureliella helgolandensis]
MLKLNLQVLLCLVACTSLVRASDQIPGAPQSHPIAIKGATLHTVAGETLVGATLLLEAGKITAIGNDPTLPADTQVIEAPGKHVYPSLIEAYSDIGLVEVNSVRATEDARETGSNNANVRAAAAFNPDSEIIPVNRANGVLLAASVPSGSLIAGRSAMMMLDGWTWESMTLKADLGMHLRSPTSKSGWQSLETIFEQAQRYGEAVGTSETRQPRDLRLEALSRVLQQEMPLIVSADGVGQIANSIAFGQRFGLKVIIYGGAEAGECLELLRSENIPVIVSAVYRNPSHRHAAYDAAYSLPNRLHEAGIAFCISAGGRFGASGVRNLPYNAGTAAAYGLPEAVALRAITLSPAEILGVADRVGALRVGMDATLFVADGDILETATQVESAFIQGRVVDLDNRHKQLYRKYSAKYDQQAAAE